MKRICVIAFLLFALVLISVAPIPATAFWDIADKTYAPGNFFQQVFSVVQTTSFSKPIGNPPVAENLELQTYRNVPLTAYFSAVDPDGDPVTFQLTDKPARGEVTINSSDPGRFLYSPYENKTGKDTFSYVAIDAAGNVSQPASVRVIIDKPSTKVTYADLTDSVFQRSAICLAEEDIFVGECMGGTYFFHPDAAVSRADFLSAALTALGVTRLSTVSQTGFADDSTIPAWAKPYAATALKLGAVRGLRNAAGQIIFSSDTSITLAEATVMLNRLLGISDVPASVSCVDQNAVPTWAYQSAANLEACGVLSHIHTGASALNASLTRGEMADLLCAALDFQKNHPSFLAL